MNVSQGVDDLNASFTVRGPEVEMSVAVPFGTGGFRYTVPDAMGTGRWLEPYVPAPWTKEVVRRARLTLFDGVLALLRGATTVKGAIGIGEGAIVLIAALDANIRAAAYKERHVGDDEAVAMEGVFNMSLSNNVAIYPEDLRSLRHLQH